MIQFQWYQFTKLNINQLYDLLRLRSSVFIVEQKCPYLDIDSQDSLALHLLGLEDDKLVAYIRLFPPTDKDNYVVFGRVVTDPSVRTKGYGKQLLQEMLDYCEKHFPKKDIRCSAQVYLKKFYESFGFKTCGDEYDEDGILHVDMIKKY